MASKTLILVDIYLQEIILKPMSVYVDRYRRRSGGEKRKYESLTLFVNSKESKTQVKVKCVVGSKEGLFKKRSTTRRNYTIM